MDKDSLLDEIKIHLVRLNDIKVYNNILDEMDYLNLINSLKFIRTELEKDTLKLDDVNTWLDNNKVRIAHIFSKYKHTNTVSHHFF